MMVGVVMLWIVDEPVFALVSGPIVFLRRHKVVLI